MAEALSKGCAIDTIPTAEEIPWCFVPGKRLHYLLCRPLRCGVFGHVEVYHSPPLMREDHQHKQHAERHRRHGKEIERDEVFRMILQKRLPRGGRWFLVARAILLDGRFRR